MVLDNRKSWLACATRSVILSLGVFSMLVADRRQLLVFGQEANNADARVANLIFQLGASSFRERESASKELLGLGEAATAALIAAESGFAPEIRQRAAMIRRQIEEDIFHELAENFLRDTELTQSQPLPGWKSFSGIVGTPRSSKLLFLEMMQEQRPIAKLIEALAEEKARPSQDLAALTACAESLKLASGQCAEKMRAMISEKYIVPEVGDTVALLTSAAMLDGQVPAEVHNLIYTTVNISNFREALRRPGYRECLLKLMGAWIPRTPETFAYDVLSLSISDGIPEGISVARRVLTDGSNPATLEPALKCLAIYGTAQDIPLAEKYLDDTFTIFEFFDDGRPSAGILGQNVVPPGGRMPNLPAVPDDPRKMTTQMRDLALAVCMKLAEQDLTRAFPRLTAPPDQFLRSDGLAFPFYNPAIRERAFKMWRESKTLKQPPPAS